RDAALDVRRERALACGARRRIGSRSLHPGIADAFEFRSSTPLPHPDRPPPGIERVEDVSLAELDPQRTPAPAARVRALDAPVDPAEGDLERNTLGRPVADLLERRTDDPDQMTAVFLAQVGFDPPAV